MNGFELGSDGPHAIVVGVDGSNTSWRALHYAVGQARRQGGRVVAVFADNIAATTFAAGAALGAVVPVDVFAELRTGVEELGPRYGVPVTFEVLNGDPVTALSRVADRERADVIVVGASVQAGHRLFGSVATRMVRCGRHPVTVVP